MKPLSKRQEQALRYLEQYKTLQRTNTDEEGWLQLKLGISRTSAIRLVRSLDDARSPFTKDEQPQPQA